MTTDRLRLLILIVAYNAEATLAPVLDRLPTAVLSDYDCEVLVIDDASEDGTFEHGLSYGQSHADLPLTVMRNQSNQGYGGNQKVGYAYAVHEGFDIVALVHGDGQYAPEELPNLLAPIVEGTADAVPGCPSGTAVTASIASRPSLPCVMPLTATTSGSTRKSSCNC